MFWQADANRKTRALLKVWICVDVVGFRVNVEYFKLHKFTYITHVDQIESEMNSCTEYTESTEPTYSELRQNWKHQSRAGHFARASLDHLP